jgi:ElaB/YqjD/DUF883 family membrane-anchored ribosome-binding protein
MAVGAAFVKVRLSFDNDLPHKTMNPQIREISDDVKTLATDVSDTIESNATGVYDEVRKGVSHALEQGKDVFGSACKRAVQEGRIAERIMHNNLYQTILLGVGAGIVMGYLCARHNACKCG